MEHGRAGEGCMHATHAEEDCGLAEGARENRGGMHARQVERSAAHGALHMERGTWSAARGTDACMHGAWQEAGRPGEDACTARGAWHMERSIRSA